MSSEPNDGVQVEEEAVKGANANRLALDQALNNVVYLARRLNFTSMEGYGSLEKSLEMAVPKCLKNSLIDETPSSSSKTACGKVASKRKQNANTVRSSGSKGTKQPVKTTPRGVQCLTAHLPVPPPPPPPSPRCPQARELCLALEKSDDLMIQFGKTDEMLDQLLYDARAIERQVAIQCQMQRDAELIRSLEVEYSGRSMRYLIEAIQADSESQHVQELRQRCLRTLKRYEERQMEMDLEEGVQDQDQDQKQYEDEGNGKGTQTDLYEYQNEMVSNMVELDRPMDMQASGAGDGPQGQKITQKKVLDEANLPID
ncbi:uncharacterized protein [Drosophila takahashii]|uniref:uncharacterized protein n=1 Tax=Drosophila takahashii TaxID=29030 RepID=UPI001CF89836|nr:uncharacterized protein LOC108065543 [Drosophila takahashii]